MVLLHDCFKNCVCLAVIRVLISEQVRQENLTMQCRKSWKLIDCEVEHIGKMFNMKNVCCVYKVLPEDNMVITKCVCLWWGRTVLNVKS